MVPLETLRELYDYNYWARDRQFEACAKLCEKQFLRPMGASFSSLRDTLAHLLAAEWAWLERFYGRSPRSFPVWLDELQSAGSIHDRWEHVEADMRKYLAGLSAELLAKPLTYVNLKGETWTYPLWKALLHVVNHQTYHRGQVTTLLRQLGAAAPQIDYLLFEDQRGA